MSFLTAVFSFRGRLRRSEFWLYSTLLFVIMVTSAGVTGELTGINLADPTDPRSLLVQLLVVLVFMWPNLAICVKRLHDRDLSGWWVLLTFLPVIGNVWTIVTLGVLRGDQGDNRYGAEPARPQLTLIQRKLASA